MAYPNPKQPKQYFDDIVAEYFKAEDKHPGWPSEDITFAVSILNEEAGKLTRIVNDVRAGRLTVDEARPDLRLYAARVGAMGLRFVEGLEQ